MIFSVNGLFTDSAHCDRLTRAVIISLFSWRRAEPDDNTDAVNGWWGDSFPTVANDRIGSRLWLLRRSKLTNGTAARARDYARQALAWLVDDGVASRVDVTATRTGLQSLRLEIVICRDGQHSITFDDLWSEIND
mgnify:CR=1 FL=1